MSRARKLLAKRMARFPHAPTRRLLARKIGRMRASGYLKARSLRSLADLYRTMHGAKWARVLRSEL